MRSRSTPFSASASDEPHALAVDEASHAVGQRLPLAPDDPSRLREKRAPSSSAKSTTASVTGGVVPCNRRSASMPARTPSGAVEPAAVGHGIEVTADDDGFGTRARHA